VGKRSSETFNQVETNSKVFISACNVANCFMYMEMTWCILHTSILIFLLLLDSSGREICLVSNALINSVNY
jgi:hypothetical protein